MAKLSKHVVTDSGGIRDGGKSPISQHIGSVPKLGFFISVGLMDSESTSFKTKVYIYTPPKTNMEPENRPLEKEIPIGNHHFQVPC